ncbi:MAG: hypothetical protein PHF20_09405 [Halothiobacillaceae bacterium]|nr:hypothetical protein [Halothiobacillaceae bacterium]
MPSFVWDRRTDEAYSEPYEYGGQEQFSREARLVLKHLKEHYSKRNQTYTRDEKSTEKAVWMLQVDGLEALSDALVMTDEKKHRIASRLFRDAVETVDMSAYFFFGGKEVQKDLAKWYENEVIPHRRFRDFIKKSHGNEKAENLTSLYGDLSKYTHRTYKAISTSYILGRHDLLVYDSFRESDTLVLPHIVSFCYALTAALIKRFMDIAEGTNQIEKDVTERIWKESLEKETVPRRFGTGPGQIFRGPPMEIFLDDEE